MNKNDRHEMTESPGEPVGHPEAPPPAFWENELEMATERLRVRAEEDGFIDDWIGRRTGRQVRVLCRNLGLDGATSVKKQKEALRSCESELLPYVLVGEFAKYKSRVATADFAGGVLPDDVLEVCRINDERFDKTALLFAIYHQRWSDLRLVFHLDKIHKSGFARMKLKESVRHPTQPFGDFLQPQTVREILEAFDKARGDGRTSEFKDVVAYDDRHLVFIRRAERPDLILRGTRVVHGYKPEWIILDFEDGARRVDISSVSVSVPLRIADRLASSYFGRTCEYENESQITYAKQIERLLGLLQRAESEELALVEIVVANSPLDGSPKIKITDPDSNPIGDAITHFEKAVGSVLSDVGHIESIKVHYRRKRISLIFEGQEGTQDEYVVRYSDHRLNAPERRLFEQHMRDTHGIPVLSTEKRFKL